MRRLPVLRLRFPQKLTSRRNDLGGPGDHIGNLKAHAGLGALSLATAMDAGDASGNLDVGHGGILADDLPSEDRGIKGNGTGRVRSPDDVFEAFHIHAREVTDVPDSGNEEMVFRPYLHPTQQGLEEVESNLL
jgi:hypothetical protein